MGAALPLSALRQQPQQLPPIDQSNPLAAGLVGFWLPNGGQFISAVPGIPAASLTSAAALASGPKGRLLKGDGSKVAGTIANDSRYLPTSAITILVDGISANAGNQYWFASEVSSNGFGMYAGGAHAYMRIGGGWADVGTGILAGEVCQGGMTYDGSTFWSIKNGKRVNSMGASGAIVQAGSGVTLGGTTTGGAGGGAWYYFAIWNRALSPAELASFYANPWQIFKGSPLLATAALAAVLAAAPVPGSATPTTINAGAASETSTGQAASLALPTAINAGAASEASTGQPAALVLPTTINAGTSTEASAGSPAALVLPTTINAGTGTETSTGPAAALVLPTAVAASTGTETSTSQPAALVLPTAVAASPGTETGNGQGALIPAATTINASTGTEAGTGQSASVTSGAGVAASTGTETGTGPAAALVLPTVIGARTGTETDSGAPASVTQPATVAASTGTETDAGRAAGLVLPTVIGARAGAETGAGQAVAITTVIPALPINPARLYVGGPRTRTFTGARRVRSIA